MVIRDVGTGGMWRCTAAAPVPGALPMCDIRRGRPAETRRELAEALIAICADIGELDPASVKVEFTQHGGEDMYHPQLGGFNHDWTGGETEQGASPP